MIRLCYRYGWCKVYRFQLPIIVIGNLTVGGNGKTPFLIWLVNKLQQRGWKVGVVSRGYGTCAKYYPLLIDDTTNPKESGDEPLLIYQRTGVSVAVSPRRAEAVAELIQSKSIDVIISDDGLQHYALWRDIELIIINGEHRFGNGYCLPAGPMRENKNRLNTVQNIIINGGNPNLGEIPMRINNANIVINLFNNKKLLLTNLTEVVAIAGIAYPNSFFSTIRAAGLIPIREISFADHQLYEPKLLNKLITSNEQLLMTEKDAIKCRTFARINWWYLPVDACLPSYAEKILLLPIEQVIRSYKL